MGGILSLLGLVLATGCAASSETSFTSSCLLPTDQSGTLNGRWTTAPIPIALHQGDFSTTEAAQIAAAVTTWNTFFGSSANLQIFDNAGGVRTSTISVPASGTLCATNDLSGTTYTQPIVIYKDSTWPTSYSPQAMALTSYCWSTGSSGSVKATASTEGIAAASTTGSVASTIQAQLRSFTVAMTEVNYQYFFTTSEVPDLQTILLHELGHVLGLNHSCNDTTTPGFPTCTGTGANTDYQDAVMYPVFGFYSDGTGQQRRSLNDNDEERANCLYQTD
jgi:hypothetical protein